MRYVIHASLTLLILGVAASLRVPANAAASPQSRDIRELKPSITIPLGKTADWVLITRDAVWVGSTGPFAVHRIDPKSNRLIASVTLPGEPCAGLSTGFGSLWIPLCTAVPSLAKINLKTNQLESVFPVGPAAAEGGVTTGAGSVWLVTDKLGSLARIDPSSGNILDTFHLPAGSYNPYFYKGVVWVSQAEGAQLTGIDPRSGRIAVTAVTGPQPRFLAGGAGAMWTLNQGDGTLTRVDVVTQKSITIALGTPGHGGDIKFQGGMVWTTMPKVPLSWIDAATTSLQCQWAGPGGDSLDIGPGAIWLTDYHAGTVARISLQDAIAHCHPRFDRRRAQRGPSPGRAE
jgi:virginiamycin B lyase